MKVDCFSISQSISHPIFHGDAQSSVSLFLADIPLPLFIILMVDIGKTISTEKVTGKMMHSKNYKEIKVYEEHYHMTIHTNAGYVEKYHCNKWTQVSNILAHFIQPQEISIRKVFECRQSHKWKWWTV